MAKRKGFGDMVESIAKPIAKTIDKVLGTDLENCEGCEHRKEILNNLGKKKPKVTDEDKKQQMKTWLGIDVRRGPSKNEMETLKGYFIEGNEEVKPLLLDIVNSLVYKQFRWTQCRECNRAITDMAKKFYEVYK